MKTLIILHGWQSSQERWRNVKNAIEKDGIEVIVPDLPGFKEGTALSRVWNLDDYVGWFKNFSSNRGNFFLLGHSFGGRMAIKFVAQYPERISGLILCSAAGIRPKRIRRYFLIMIGVKIGKRFSFLPFYSRLRKFFYRFVIRKQDYLKVSGIMKETFIKIIDEEFKEGNKIFVHTSEGRKPTSFALLFASYRRKNKVEGAYYITEENHELIKLPPLSFEVNETKKSFLKEIVKGNGELKELQNKLKIRQSAAYQNIDELKKEGYLEDSKELKLTDLGRIMIL